MSTEHRRMKFRERLEVERQVLIEVNQVVGSLAPLAGITDAAVMEWRRIAVDRLPEATVQQVSSIVSEIASALSVSADHSQDVFEEDDDDLAPIDSLLFDLRAVLRRPPN